MYVLNGSLVGYIGVKAISRVTDNEKLKIYCKTVEKTYENRCEQFHYDNDEWTYYMLNPKTVIPIHYMIFEKKLFESMYYLSGIQCFQDEANFRERLLKKVLKVEFYEEENVINYFISRACSPNFYQIDTYGTRIEFYDSNDMLLEENECLIKGETQREEFYEGAFIKGELVHDNAEYYKLYAVYNTNSYLLFQENISMENKKDSFREVEIENIETVYDASLESDGRSVLIKKDLSEKVEGDIIFELGTGFCWNGIFALEINNLSHEEINIGLKVYDSKGNGAIRYYTPLTEGKNLVVFDARGFAGADALQDIKSIWLRIYNNDSSQNELNIEMGNLWSISNVRALYNCITQSEYKINPQ